MAAGRFNAASTADQVLQDVDLSSRRVLITGVSAGIGLETARACAARGATVVGTARDLAKAGAALAPFGDLGIEAVGCDLASLASLRACADELIARALPFDVIIANAGVMNCPYGRTEDGFEIQLGTNFLGHFVLINRLLPLLRDGGRVVIVSSSAHRASDVDLDDPNFEATDYDPLVAYGRSKTADILLAVEMDRRLASRGVRVTALHPGGIMTDLLRYTTPELLQQMASQLSDATDNDHDPDEPVVKTVAQGAATTVWAAFVAPAEEIGGRYCIDCRVAVVDASSSKAVAPYAVDPERAKALWAKSEAWVGERF